jgi:hypothetical protein
MVKGNSFLTKIIFLNLLSDSSNVSYRVKKGDTLARKPPC